MLYFHDEAFLILDIAKFIRPEASQRYLPENLWRHLLHTTLKGQHALSESSHGYRSHRGLSSSDIVHSRVQQAPGRHTPNKPKLFEQTTERQQVCALARIKAIYRCENGLQNLLLAISAHWSNGKHGAVVR